MSIRLCIHCRTAYWNYSPSTVPKRYCSMQCWEARRRQFPRAVTVEDLPPAPPTEIQEVLRLHLQKAHGTSDLNSWFDSCSICERLNEALVISQRSMV
jgi:hypothetical protein